MTFEKWFLRKTGVDLSYPGLNTNQVYTDQGTTRLNVSWVNLLQELYEKCPPEKTIPPHISIFNGCDYNREDNLRTALRNIAERLNFLLERAREEDGS